MKIRPILQWLWINLKIFVVFFGIVGILVGLFPEFMLKLFGQWAILMQAFGAKSAAQLGSPEEMFKHILTTNSLTLVIYMFLGLLLQAPLVMPFTGAFYALVIFLAPWTIGRSFSLADWVLVGAEILILLLGSSITSGVAGELYEVHPNLRSVAQYWKRAWRKLWLRPTVSWKAVLQAWYASLLAGSVVLIALLLFVAWFETYGY
jgi:hypothetical protein